MAEEVLSHDDWNLSQTEHEGPLPTYKPDDPEVKSFSVNYVSVPRDFDETEFISSEDDNETADSIDPRESALIKRDTLTKHIKILSEKIEQKRKEIISKVGLSTFSDIYSFFRANVDDSEIDQASIDSFVYSKLTAENLDVGFTQVVHLVYVILSLEIEVRDSEEAVKALNFELI